MCRNRCIGTSPSAFCCNTCRLRSILIIECVDHGVLRMWRRLCLSAMLSQSGHLSSSSIVIFFQFSQAVFCWVGSKPPPDQIDLCNQNTTTTWEAMLIHRLNILIVVFWGPVHLCGSHPAPVLRPVLQLLCSNSQNVSKPNLRSFVHTIFPSKS